LRTNFLFLSLWSLTWSNGIFSLNQHSELDDAIERFNEKIPFDQVKLQRLKKRKLVLKDEIKKLNSQILPDIIA
jgi:hypothetical protein